MRVTLCFKDDEETEARQAMQGVDAHAALQDMDNRLRDLLKYHEHPADVVAMLQQLREELHAICDDRGVRVWE
jgi:hypothetical protein